MKKILYALAGLELLEPTEAFKVGIITDLHLHLRYNQSAQHLDECTNGAGDKTAIEAPMGRYQCDCPPILIETMLHRFDEHFGKQDVIFLTGDFAAHHVAMHGPDAPNTYNLLLDTFYAVNSLLKEQFPDTIILPAFGNADAKYHDNPIPESDRAFFYDYVYNLWFNNLPGNRHLIPEQEKKAIADTFNKGGYYRVDLNDKVSTLVLNTLYYDSKRDYSVVADAGEGAVELKWLEE